MSDDTKALVSREAAENAAIIIQRQAETIVELEQTLKARLTRLESHAAVIVRLERELAEALAYKPDAKRYRWLRDEARYVDWAWASENMDAAIDAAMKGASDGPK